MCVYKNQEITVSNKTLQILNQSVVLSNYKIFFVNTILTITPIIGTILQ